jgi:cell wall-associated NlpC family hydrolase
VIRLGCLGLALAAATSTAGFGTAGATPPPPPNPSDSSITAAQAAAAAKAGQVGQIASQLAQAQSTLAGLQDQVELKEEDANKAMVDLQTAQDAADAAQGNANSAQVGAQAAANAVTQLRAQVDQFVYGSFAQGSALGSVSAYLTANSPGDLLERQRLLDAISTSQLDVLNRMREARTQQANADSLARAALIAAQGKQAQAAAAKRAADAAIAAAVAAQQGQAAQAAQLQNNQNSLQAQLTAAQAKVGDLTSQRAQYEAWLAAKQAAEEQAQAAAAAAARHRGGGGGHVSAGSGAVAAVIARAMAQIGMPYAWGGGTASGPSRGIHDGGVADMYGDYNKIGFDCSGLMVYAYAAAGVYLPHYSGYQYTAGQHVPISDIRPGDLLFYSSDGAPDGIHHVTMYVGGGQMIEAYESGTTIRVTSVRYSGGLLPYATRLL